MKKRTAHSHAVASRASCRTSTRLAAHSAAFSALVKREEHLPLCLKVTKPCPIKPLASHVEEQTPFWKRLKNRIIISRMVQKSTEQDEENHQLTEAEKQESLKVIKSEIVTLESNLVVMREEKHGYFVTLKTTLKEEERLKRNADNTTFLNPENTARENSDKLTTNAKTVPYQNDNDRKLATTADKETNHKSMSADNKSASDETPEWVVSQVDASKIRLFRKRSDKIDKESKDVKGKGDQKPHTEGNNGGRFFRMLTPADFLEPNIDYQIQNTYNSMARKRLCISPHKAEDIGRRDITMPPQCNNFLSQPSSAMAITRRADTKNSTAIEVGSFAHTFKPPKGNSMHSQPSSTKEFANNGKRLQQSKAMEVRGSGVPLMPQKVNGLCSKPSSSTEKDKCSDTTMPPKNNSNLLQQSKAMEMCRRADIQMPSKVNENLTQPSSTTVIGRRADPIMPQKGIDIHSQSPTAMEIGKCIDTQMPHNGKSIHSITETGRCVNTPMLQKDNGKLLQQSHFMNIGRGADPKMMTPAEYLDPSIEYQRQNMNKFQASIKTSIPLSIMDEIRRGANQLPPKGNNIDSQPCTAMEIDRSVDTQMPDKENSIQSKHSSKMEICRLADTPMHPKDVKKLLHQSKAMKIGRRADTPIPPKDNGKYWRPSEAMEIDRRADTPMPQKGKNMHSQPSTAMEIGKSTDTQMPQKANIMDSNPSSTPEIGRCADTPLSPKNHGKYWRPSEALEIGVDMNLKVYGKYWQPTSITAFGTGLDTPMPPQDYGKHLQQSEAMEIGRRADTQMPPKVDGKYWPPSSTTEKGRHTDIPKHPHANGVHLLPANRIYPNHNDVLYLPSAASHPDVSGVPYLPPTTLPSSINQMHIPSSAMNTNRSPEATMYPKGNKLLPSSTTKINSRTDIPNVNGMHKLPCSPMPPKDNGMHLKRNTATQIDHRMNISLPANGSIASSPLFAAMEITKRADTPIYPKGSLMRSHSLTSAHDGNRRADTPMPTKSIGLHSRPPITATNVQHNQKQQQKRKKQLQQQLQQPQRYGTSPVEDIRLDDNPTQWAATTTTYIQQQQRKAGNSLPIAAALSVEKSRRADTPMPPKVNGMQLQPSKTATNVPRNQRQQQLPQRCGTKPEVISLDDTPTPWATTTYIKPTVTTSALEGSRRADTPMPPKGYSMHSQPAITAANVHHNLRQQAEQLPQCYGTTPVEVFRRDGNPTPWTTTTATYIQQKQQQERTVCNPVATNNMDHNQRAGTPWAKPEGRPRGRSRAASRTGPMRPPKRIPTPTPSPNYGNQRSEVPVLKNSVRPLRIKEPTSTTTNASQSRPYPNPYQLVGPPMDPRFGRREPVVYPGGGCNVPYGVTTPGFTPPPPPPPGAGHLKQQYNLGLYNNQFHQYPMGHQLSMQGHPNQQYRMGAQMMPQVDPRTGYQVYPPQYGQHPYYNQNGNYYFPGNVHWSYYNPGTNK